MATTAEKIDAGKTMKEMWEGFSEAVIPFAPPGTTQHEEMKKAFYSGALCLFNWFMVQMDEGDDVTDADMDRVTKISEEIHAFMIKVGGRSVQ